MKSPQRSYIPSCVPKHTHCYLLVGGEDHANPTMAGHRVFVVMQPLVPATRISSASSRPCCCCCRCHSCCCCCWAWQTPPSHHYSEFRAPPCTRCETTDYRPALWSMQSMQCSTCGRDTKERSGGDVLTHVDCFLKKNAPATPAGHSSGRTIVAPVLLCDETL